MKAWKDTGALLYVLNFSAGSQSTAILHMVLRGEIEKPRRFLVLSADPGMEASETKRHRALMHERCAAAGIKFAIAPGPDLKNDLIQLSGKKRIDNPPYWTLGQGGSIGRLQHKCTREYKVAPMDRWLRGYLSGNYSISRDRSNLTPGLITKWIGFAADESARVKPSNRGYINFDFPLIRLGMTRAMVSEWYAARGLEEPPRSVCNGCFANDADYFEAMYRNRPSDWAEAVAVDDSIRDMSSVGVHDEVFVCRSMLPLREMAARDFKLDPAVVEQSRCDAGYCFV